MKVAVIGTGAWGSNLVRSFAGLGCLEAIYDANRERAGALGAAHGARAAESYEALLGDAAIQGVAVATPAETHYAVARQALEAGKDVLVEKPITLDCGECADLIERAERAGRILMVGHLLKFHPAIRKLKELVASGQLGRLEYLYSNRLNLGKVRREENALWSFAPHDISVILHLLNDRLPIQVAATGGTYLQPNICDVTVSSLLFEHGVRGHIFVSWLHPYKEQRLVVVGSAAMACFDDVAPREKLRVFSRQIGMDNGHYVTRPPVGTPVAYEEAEPLREECRHFLECMARRTAPLTDGRDGLRVLRVLRACQRSLELNGEPVQVSAAALAAAG